MTTVEEEREEYRRADDIEREYLREIDAATLSGDNDAAFELSTGLTEYREHYKT